MHLLSLARTAARWAACAEPLRGRLHGGGREGLLGDVMRLRRPEPLLHHRARRVDRYSPPSVAAKRLLDGQTLLVDDQYDTGVRILEQLYHDLNPPSENASYAARQGFQEGYRTASVRLLAPIEDHRLALTGAGEIGFLDDLYPEVRSFFLPFVHAQALYGAWMRYREGVHLAVLGYRVHPYYGTYAPTRTTHLELLATWLSQYDGPRERAVDVGTGCGVLALMLEKAGFARVLATDINPNAIESVARELKRRPITGVFGVSPIVLAQGDLFAEDEASADLIVFNPPWIPGRVADDLDRALYFEGDLFERFFAQAHARLTLSGRIVMVFSNVMQLVRPDVQHPIVAELGRGRLRLVKKLHRKVKPSVGRGGRHRRTRERVEVWELAR